MMKLYGLGPTRSLRARWALQELDAEFEFVPINLLAGENRHPDFLRLNPTGKLPVLVDGDLVLTESAAIVMYLAEKYGAKGLMPTDLSERAQTRVPRLHSGSQRPSRTCGRLLLEGAVSP